MDGIEDEEKAEKRQGKDQPELDAGGGGLHGPPHR
jgi:hypothetical protein